MVCPVALVDERLAPSVGGRARRIERRVSPGIVPVCVGASVEPIDTVVEPAYTSGPWDNTASVSLKFTTAVAAKRTLLCISSFPSREGGERPAPHPGCAITVL